ncbi:MAG: M48 family peptidase [Betaproteobacteria bacterium]|nr:MAG: M48 family peptidase [Betaproteobacteria bacterium]
MHSLTLLFILFFGAGLALRYGLATRQMRHVTRHRAAVPTAFANDITLDTHQKAADYTLAKTRLARLQLFAEASLLLTLTLMGGLQWLYDQGAPITTDALWQGAGLLLSLGIVSALVDLPFDLWRQFVIDARFGFNRQTARGYLIDLLRQTLVGLAIGVPLLLTVLWLMGQAGAHWWLWTWLVWAGFNLTLLALYPTLIAPLFNKFTPLADGELKTRIEALLQRCGFHSAGVFVMDGSRRSSHGNAYFTGLGRSRRVVFYDTLLNQLDPAQTEAVLAHELGHAHHQHIRKRLAVMFALSLGLLYLLAQLKAMPAFYASFGVSTLTDATALALFFLVLPVFTFPFSPVFSASSRRHEFEADRYAAQHSSAAALISALLRLYKENASTLTPDPFYALFYNSHPQPTERIGQLERIKP